MAGESEAAVAVRNLYVAYDHRPVLRGVRLAVPAGLLVALVGPNGAGKSTLFKAILGLVRPAAGTVRVFGQPVERQRRRIAYVPQRELIDWDFPATVSDVVMMGRVPRLGWLRRPGPEDRRRVAEALEEVGMAAYARRPLAALSGGQQQRVFIARALAQDADLILLDEPYAGVDAATQEVVRRLLGRLRDAGKTILVVDHDLSGIGHYDRVALINGRVIAFGPPAEVMTAERLRETYGGRLTYLDRVVLPVPGGVRA
ncbi:metal ABC transporter ATP-binding protein [Thermaerobacter subterraneus]|uniref:ATPase component of Mn/Zn ABC-type transporter n=1 Tax=Thermaerobacter subterraneus DSM 13965 TaxID=867903 RepID=K6Q2G9_9FIRM|nr:metal ABC transporter ATP-binding protein [Thermaerobacter subterraneus]EKP95209.1 ATPase component of Mn/Zn ABC-type transporter [Thermaerobacter subterraneus DSM 13965]